LAEAGKALSQSELVEQMEVTRSLLRLFRQEVAAAVVMMWQRLPVCLGVQVAVVQEEMPQQMFREVRVHRVRALAVGMALLLELFLSEMRGVVEALISRERTRAQAQVETAGTV
jgi:hypothetical protein